MTVNKWTLGLVSVGLISLGSVAQAEERLSAVQTALSSTTISGYVDTSAQWNVGTGNANAPGYSYGGPGKADGFNLNSALLTLEKPLDEGQWSAGYRVDLQFGPDAATLGTGSDIRQAYVAMRAPVGNGLDLKLGVWDTIIGYESTDSFKNPNFTRSWGYTIEPTTHTGLLAEYVLSDMFTFKAGVANDTGPVINSRAHAPMFGGPGRAESYKAYMAAITINAPEGAGALHGSSLTVGAVNGYNQGLGDTSLNLYAGGNIATPVEGLGVGVSFDHVSSDLDSVGPNSEFDAWTAAIYTSFKVTDKLGLHARAEYFEADTDIIGTSLDSSIGTLTGTIQYDLWENVLTRLEIRWDHVFDARGNPAATTFFGRAANEKNSLIVAANVVYRF